MTKLSRQMRKITKERIKEIERERIQEGQRKYIEARKAAVPIAEEIIANLPSLIEAQATEGKFMLQVPFQSSGHTFTEKENAVANIIHTWALEQGFFVRMGSNYNQWDFYQKTIRDGVWISWE